MKFETVREGVLVTTCLGGGPASVTCFIYKRSSSTKVFLSVQINGRWKSLPEFYYVINKQYMTELLTFDDSKCVSPNTFVFTTSLLKIKIYKTTILPVVLYG